MFSSSILLGAMATPLRLAAAALALTASTAAWSQEYPTQAIKIAVPFSAGGVTDIVIRQLAKSLEAEFKQPVVVENKPGANGTVAPSQLIGLRPDGYQLSVASAGVFRQPFLAKTPLSKPVSELTYIASIADYSYVLVARGDAPWASVADLVAALKAAPRCNYGSSGEFSTAHLTMEDIAKAAGFSCAHVPFKGSNESLLALGGGQIDLAVAASGGQLDALAAAGKVKLLATLGDERAPMYPNLPTLKQIGIPVVASSPFGLIGPAGMDKRVVNKLAEGVRKAMAEKPMTELLAKNGAIPRFQDPSDYTAEAAKAWNTEVRRFGSLAADKK